MKLRVLTGTLFFFFAIPALCLYSADQLSNKEIIRLINNYRKTQGLKPLKENDKLRQSAGRKVREMLSTGYFGHTGPGGEPFNTNIERSGYAYTHVGEVLARGCENEARVLRVWVNSPPHRRALVDPAFRDIGCSSLPARNDGSWAVCHLGTTRR